MKENKESRVVRGLCDLYKVYKATDAITGNEFMEVHRLFEVDKGIYDEVYLGDIDGTIKESDEDILNEIDARFDNSNAMHLNS